MKLENEGNEDMISHNVGSIIIVYVIEENESGYSIINGVYILLYFYSFFYLINRLYIIIYQSV